MRLVSSKIDGFSIHFAARSSRYSPQWPIIRTQNVCAHCFDDGKRPQIRNDSTHQSHISIARAKCYWSRDMPRLWVGRFCTGVVQRAHSISRNKTWREREKEEKKPFHTNISIDVVPPKMIEIENHPFPTDLALLATILALLLAVPLCVRPIARRFIREIAACVFLLFGGIIFESL